MKQFNPLDSALLFLEKPRTPFHVSTVTIYDPSTCPGKPPSFEDIVEEIERCLPIAESFRRKIVRVPMDFDHPYWIEDEDFDLEYHIRQVALPKPGNWEQFRTQISRLISRPLDLTRSPWEMTVIEGLDSIEGLPKGCFATVLKVHHCAIDGVTGVSLMNAMHQDSPRKRAKKVEDRWQPEEEPSRRQLLRWATLNSIRHPIAISRLVWSNARSLAREAFKDLRSDDDDDTELNAPETILNGEISAHRVVDFGTCSLDDLKRVRKAVEGATINDVCLTIVAQAMRRYLDSTGDLPAESLVTMVPISTRTPDQVSSGGNQISITRVSLYSDIEDPIQRLAVITRDTQKLKAMQDGVMVSTLLDVVHNLPGALIGAAARAVSVAGAASKSISNTMVTNVPGPMQPIYFRGAQAVKMFGSPPLMDGGGLLHCVGSYNGEFIFCFTACRDMLPDPDFYRDCLMEAAQEVIAAADRRA